MLFSIDLESNNKTLWNLCAVEHLFFLFELKNWMHCQCEIRTVDKSKFAPPNKSKCHSKCPFRQKLSKGNSKKAHKIQFKQTNLHFVACDNANFISDIKLYAPQMHETESEWFHEQKTCSFKPEQSCWFTNFKQLGSLKLKLVRFRVNLIEYLTSAAQTWANVWKMSKRRVACNMLYKKSPGIENKVLNSAGERVLGRKWYKVNVQCNVY